MYLPTIEQVKAARQLLKWSQGTLAKHAGVNVSVVSKFEAGSATPHMKSMSAIVTALEVAGITFTPTTVGYDPRMIVIYEGDDSYYKVLDDVIHTLKNSADKEALFFLSDETLSPPAVVQTYREMRAMGIRFRSLVRQNDTYIMGPFSEYRMVPRRLFKHHDNLQLLYGTKVAQIVNSGSVDRAVVIDNDIHAVRMKAFFEYFWDEGDPPTETTCKDLFDV